MQWTDITVHPRGRTLRQFAATWLVFFGVLAAQQQFHRGHTSLAITLAVVGAVIGVAGLAHPPLVRWLYVGAMVVAFPIGWLVSLAAMALLFYGVFMPVALAFRLAGRDLLRRRRTDAATFWQPKPRVTDPGRYLRQF